MCREWKSKNIIGVGKQKTPNVPTVWSSLRDSHTRYTIYPGRRSQRGNVRPRAAVGRAQTRRSQPDRSDTGLCGNHGRRLGTCWRSRAKQSNRGVQTTLVSTQTILAHRRASSVSDEPSPGADEKIIPPSQTTCGVGPFVSADRARSSRKDMSGKLQNLLMFPGPWKDLYNTFTFDGLSHVLPDSSFSVDVFK